MSCNFTISIIGTHSYIDTVSYIAVKAITFGRGKINKIRIIKLDTIMQDHVRITEII